MVAKSLRGLKLVWQKTKQNCTKVCVKIDLKEKRMKMRKQKKTHTQNQEIFEMPSDRAGNIIKTDSCYACAASL